MWRIIRAIEMPDERFIEQVKAMACDVFGTVVDWRSSIIEEGERLGLAKELRIEWGNFADRWRAGYLPALDRVRKGELPWTNLDGLHRLILDSLLVDFGITGLSESEKEDFNRLWHRLKPWPDSVSGLTRLKKKYVIATLSNGNVALLTNMAKRADLPWDCILSAELIKRYKPDREVYQMSSELLGLRNEEVMMVASHPGDLRAAAAVGLRTALILRPLEYGPNRTQPAENTPPFDVVAQDLNDLARQFGL